MNRLSYPYILFLLFSYFQVHGQEAVINRNRVTNQNRIWFAYMTSADIGKKWAWWNDYHYVPDGFFVARTGLTYKISKSTSVTAGYAFGLLPTDDGSKTLRRKEQRPWAQVVASVPLENNFQLNQRVRYDARFRQKTIPGEMTDGYIFHNRIRLQSNLRKNIPQWKFGDHIPYIALMDEIMLNFGKNVINAFDQNRLSLAIGVKRPNTQYQLGYMSRFVQNTGAYYTRYHMLTIWVSQQFDFRNKQ